MIYKQTLIVQKFERFVRVIGTMEILYFNSWLWLVACYLLKICASITFRNFRPLSKMEESQCTHAAEKVAPLVIKTFPQNRL